MEASESKGNSLKYIFGAIFLVLFIAAVIFRWHFSTAYVYKETGFSPNQDIEFLIYNEAGEAVLATQSDMWEKDFQMLFFYTERCSVCQRMEEFLPDFEKGCAPEKLEFIRVDVSLMHNSRIANEYRVRGVPMISMINREGDEVMSAIGFIRERDLRRQVEAIMNITCS